MSDEEIALKLLEIQCKNSNYLISDEYINNAYQSHLKHLENAKRDNVVFKIKKIYEENNKQGAYCGADGVRMLQEIKKVIDNYSEDRW